MYRRSEYIAGVLGERSDFLSILDYFLFTNRATFSIFEGSAKPMWHSQNSGKNIVSFYQSRFRFRFKSLQLILYRL